MAKIAKGSKVRQVVQPIEGEVVKTRYDEDTGALTHLVAYKGTDGEDHQVWFAEGNLEDITPEAPAEGSAA